LVDLCHGYVATRGQRVPLDVGERHEGVATPAWMLAVAVVRPGGRDLVSDTLELALAARVPRGALADCVAYVEMAAALFAGRTTAEAVAGPAARGAATAALPGAPLRLTGEGPADALGAGIWALHQPGGLPEVLPELARVATPGVAAAVGGLLGLRDGCGAMPAHWQRRVRGAAACLALAPGLVRARCRSHRDVAVRPPDEAAVERPPGEPAAAPHPEVATPTTASTIAPTAAPVGEVAICRPLGRIARPQLVRKQLADLVGAR
jgi:hypothetical protein